MAPAVLALGVDRATLQDQLPLGTCEPCRQDRYLNKIILLLGRRKGNDASKATARVPHGQVGAGGQPAWILSAAAPLTSCMNWGKPLWFLRPQIFSSYNKVIKLGNF